MKRRFFYIMTPISCKIALYHSKQFEKWYNAFYYWRAEHRKEVGVIDD